MALKPITTKDWYDYEWIEATGRLEDLYGQVVCIRGVKKTSPPDDGYHYIEVTSFEDTEQKWARALEVTKD